MKGKNNRKQDDDDDRPGAYAVPGINRDTSLFSQVSERTTQPLDNEAEAVLARRRIQQLERLIAALEQSRASPGGIRVGELVESREVFSERPNYIAPPDLSLAQPAAFPVGGLAVFREDDVNARQDQTTLLPELSAQLVDESADARRLQELENEVHRLHEQESRLTRQLEQYMANESAQIPVTATTVRAIPVYQEESGLQNTPRSVSDGGPGSSESRTYCCCCFRRRRRQQQQF